jgi:VWFA-related protein
VTSPVVLLAVASVAIASIVLQEPQQPRHVERVDVARVIVDVRVLDDQGNPVVDLGADDFRVKIDGRPARVDSALWVGDTESHPTTRYLDGVPLLDRIGSSQGRLIVFLFQKSLEGSRITGLMQMLIQARRFFETLTPDDRVAVLSFDSHLKVWIDFTNDRRRLEWILKEGILFERPPPVQEATPISLVARLNPAEGRRAYSIEKGLRLIAEALEPLPGSKAIVLVGHGFGRLGRMGVTMENEYERRFRRCSRRARRSSRST